jgi:hypothetical protein
MEEGYKEERTLEITPDGRMVEEKASIKVYGVNVRQMEGSIKIILRKEEKYTRVKVNDKDVMIYIGENRKRTRWMTELNNEVKSHITREDAENYIVKKMTEMVRYLGEKANHIYRVGKTNEYDEGKLIKHEYGNLEIARIDKLGESWSLNVLGRGVWVYGSKRRRKERNIL